jgi:hypothetical protein
MLPHADEYCTSGADELGFVTLYENTKGNQAQTNQIGVVDQQMGFVAGGAPDGNRYYFIEDPGGFAYVMTDTVMLGDAYTNLQVRSKLTTQSNAVLALYIRYICSLFRKTSTPTSAGGCSILSATRRLRTQRSAAHMGDSIRQNRRVYQ